MNALPILLLGGAALMMMGGKGTKGGVPSNFIGSSAEAQKNKTAISQGHAVLIVCRPNQKSALRGQVIKIAKANPNVYYLFGSTDELDVTMTACKDGDGAAMAGIRPGGKHSDHLCFPSPIDMDGFRFALRSMTTWVMDN